MFLGFFAGKHFESSRLRPCAWLQTCAVTTCSSAQYFRPMVRLDMQRGKTTAKNWHESNNWKQKTDKVSPNDVNCAGDDCHILWSSFMHDPPGSKDTSCVHPTTILVVRKQNSNVDVLSKISHLVINLILSNYCPPYDYKHSHRCHYKICMRLCKACLISGLLSAWSLVSSATFQPTTVHVQYKVNWTQYYCRFLLGDPFAVTPALTLLVFDTIQVNVVENVLSKKFFISLSQKLKSKP